ncbi:MAG: family 10 glycosylhydrolase, partial [Lacipirellulaceae bacterium]
FNPYRASHPSGKSELSEDHISKLKPEAVREYGKYLWLDPGEPSAVDHSLAVILDVVRRYDIDGVHFDDYFYPYPINDDDGKPLDFPDEASWEKSQATSASLSRNDWRRQNVNQFIARVAEEVKKAKPWVKFGVSPFGIWRPGYPSGVTGFDAYDKLYADSQKWFHEGTVDYLTPQLYWKLGSKGQSYSALLRWWQEENKQNRHLWPGQYTSRLLGEGAKAWPSEEIVAQIWATRAQEGATGNVHFSMKALARNSDGIADDLKSGAYQEPALVPATPWLDARGKVPAIPKVEAKLLQDLAVVEFATEDGKQPWLWTVSAKYGPHWKIRVVPGHNNRLEMPETSRFEGELHALESVGVSAVDRLGRQSEYSSTVYSSGQSH